MNFKVLNLLVIFFSGYSLSLFLVLGKCETFLDQKDVSCVGDRDASSLKWNVNSSNISRVSSETPGSSLLVTDNNITCGEVKEKSYPRDGNLTLDLQIKNVTCNASLLSFIVYSYHSLGEGLTEAIECVFNIIVSCNESNSTHSVATTDPGTGVAVGPHVHDRVDDDHAFVAAIIPVGTVILFFVVVCSCGWLWPFPQSVILGFIGFRKFRNKKPIPVQSPDVRVVSHEPTNSMSTSEQVTNKRSYRRQPPQSIVRDGFENKSKDDVPDTIQHMLEQQEKKLVTGDGNTQEVCTTTNGAQTSHHDTSQTQLIYHNGVISPYCSPAKTSTSVNILPCGRIPCENTAQSTSV